LKRIYSVVEIDADDFFFRKREHLASYRDEALSFTAAAIGIGLAV